MTEPTDIDEHNAAISRRRLLRGLLTETFDKRLNNFL